MSGVIKMYCFTKEANKHNLFTLCQTSGKVWFPLVKPSYFMILDTLQTMMFLSFLSKTKVFRLKKNQEIHKKIKKFEIAGPQNLPGSHPASQAANQPTKRAANITY